MQSITRLEELPDRVMQAVQLLQEEAKEEGWRGVQLSVDKINEPNQKITVDLKIQERRDF